MTATYSDLQDKAIIVTGASSGIGRKLAIQLAQQGASVGLLDIVKPDEVADEIQKLTKQARTISLAVDVTKADQVDAAVQQVLSTFGRLDGAANVAGIVGNRQVWDTSHGLETLKDENWDKIMRVNLDGVKNCLRAEFRAMKGPGAIVNAASISGQMANPFATAYSVSKWGVIGLTKGAAGEVGSRGIRVNSVAPGPVKTALTESLGQEALTQLFAPRMALGRIADPEDVTPAFMFLLSDASGYMTGTVLNVDGGYM